MLNLIMPMGGRGSRFSEHGYNCPKPLIDIHGAPFFYWATQSIRKFVALNRLIFVVLQEHIDQFHIDNEIKKYFPEAIIHVIPEVLNGAVLTCLEGVKEVYDGPLLFNDCDQMFLCQEFYDFCAKAEFAGVDGALLTFTANEPKYGYLEYDGNGDVIRTVEKEVISNDAICGAYYFRDVQLFKNTVEDYLRNCNYQEYFLSGLYNVMAAGGKKIKGFKTDFHIAFGTPEEYQIAIMSDRFEELK